MSSIRTEEQQSTTIPADTQESGHEVGSRDLLAMSSLLNRKGTAS